MDVPTGGIPNPSPIQAAPSALASNPIVWPRSARVTVTVLLSTCLILLAGRSLVQSIKAGPSTLPPQRVDLNSATHAELMLLPGVGDSLAVRIAKSRDALGPFQKVDDLRRVAGIGPTTLERLRPWVFVSANLPPILSQPSLPLAVEPAKRTTAQPNKATLLDAPIDVNAADAALLMRIPGIGPVLSQRIVDERGKKAFAAVDDLRRVRGIGPKILERIRPFVAVSKPATAVARSGVQ